jgi:hypothetical protein
MKFTEQLSTREWALIAAFGDDPCSGLVSTRHRAQPDLEKLPQFIAMSLTVQEAGLRTQNYDKGLQRVIRKFNPDEPMATTTAIDCGYHGERIWAVYFTQDNRRRLLSDTLYNSSDEEALWTSLAAWAEFQPRRKQPRSEPGELYFPTEFTHILGQYWDFLPNLQDHPDFPNESARCQEQMDGFSEALLRMDLSNFETHPTVEAKDRDVTIARDAAVSRLLPIQDGVGQRELHRSIVVTGLGGLAPD